MTFRWCLPAISLLALAVIAIWPLSHVYAQSLEVSPISIELQPGQMTTTLAITNQGSAPTVLQIRPFQWDQANGADRLTATEQLLVSPPITNVPAGQTQTFRLVLQRPAEETEASYRLLLDQLPAPAMAGAVRIALRISIPVFVEPEAMVYSALDWQIDSSYDGDVLVGVNRGSKHLHILNLVVVGSNGRRLVPEAGQISYILPGAEGRWPLGRETGFLPGSAVHLVALSDAGPVDAAVHVSGP